ncbi:hypothetical protein MKEN_01256600 [Mycena kentingensis (nom. inval.)]|nr:hypothetical protein MKEN_01256600 [Mycena kentingensis (nom. inval.)]
MSRRALPFYTIAAFADSPFAGNPAVVVFLDDHSIDDDTLKKIAANFNQPITAFVYETPKNSPEDKLEIRWFTSSHVEVALCGHGTLCAARAVFERGLVAGEVVEFQTRKSGVVRAVKRGGKLEIRLPKSTVTALEAGEKKDRIVQALRMAFKTDSLEAEFVGEGGVGFETYLLVELKLTEGKTLGDYEIDGDALVSSVPRAFAVYSRQKRETGYMVNVLTTPSNTPNALFFSRMFAPLVFAPGSPEDHVCGSAHCLLAPYWAAKHTLGVTSEFAAKQVSKRGGHLDVSVLRQDEDSSKEVVSLKGETCIISSGEIYV